jgi:hypothetical protein
MAFIGILLAPALVAGHGAHAIRVSKKEMREGPARSSAGRAGHVSAPACPI